MPPIAPSSNTSSIPLADHFFIAGVETTSIIETNARGNRTTISPHLSAAIEEDISFGKSVSTRSSGDVAGIEDARKLARFSWEPRKSIGSLIGLDAPNSNRNSTHNELENGSRPPNSSDADFEQALRAFVADRDTFLDDIQFSAGQLAQPNRPRPKPRTQRIVGEDARRADLNPVSGLKRRISTMKPNLSRSSTSVRRTTASNRASKRLSGYNSVIPAPQQFKPPTNMHPLKRPYEPVLLDQYPSQNSNDASKERCPFPDYVPMFVFPNDVNVVSADERPRTTWHGFALTTSDNSKLHGLCLITWMPLHNDAAAELEWQCEQWRNQNMSKEEREMARDLGERLAMEKTKLSELLAELPRVSAGSAAREAHEEEITAVEDRITLMMDALKPVRHGASSKINGLTDNDTGFWIPRAYGVLGRDAGMMNFWKEWLRAITVPMMNGQILRVPPSSPRVGTWQPLERYVINICAEAPSPLSSITQVELAVRELRLYARKEALNEIPGSRNADLFALFRCLDVPDIVVLIEYVLSESRVILLSSHTAMLHLASAAITQLIYPLKWAGVFIPVLPARLIQALEAPCPYIVGIERRYESVELPEDDFVIVDLDNGTIESTNPPVHLPRQQRRKLVSILQLAAPHRYRYGVDLGPPKYAAEAFPFDLFSTENTSIYNPTAPPSNLAYLANLGSASFGPKAVPEARKPPVFNAFLASRNTRDFNMDRPGTGASIVRATSPASPALTSISMMLPPLPSPMPRSDSGSLLQASLREKRSGYLNESQNPLRRNSSFGMNPIPHRKSSGSPLPSVPGHASTTSISTLGGSDTYGSTYAPSVYAQSTLAASTIMPEVMMQPVRETDTQIWTEGHSLQWINEDDKSTCNVCDEAAEEGIYKCSGCGMFAHVRCSRQISVVCPSAFYPDQIMAAFIRCFASLFYTYRKYLVPATSAQKKAGLIYRFNMDGFLRSVPHENADYMNMLRDTQIFNEFISEREMKRSDDPSIRLFDEIILSKRNRGRAGIFSKSSTNFIQDNSDHLFHTAAAPAPSVRTRPGQASVASQEHGAGQNGRSVGDVRSSDGKVAVIGRIPAKLDKNLLKEPRIMQGVVLPNREKPRRKEIPLHLRTAQTEPSQSQQPQRRP